MVVLSDRPKITSWFYLVPKLQFGNEKTHIVTRNEFTKCYT
jgi:hypothetical protein